MVINRCVVKIERVQWQIHEIFRFEIYVNQHVQILIVYAITNIEMLINLMFCFSWFCLN